MARNSTSQTPNHMEVSNKITKEGSGTEHSERNTVTHNRQITLLHPSSLLTEELAHLRLELGDGSMWIAIYASRPEFGSFEAIYTQEKCVSIIPL